MKSNFEDCLARVLASEGGYVNHKSDPGGMTNLGCTKAVWEEFVVHPVSEADMRALTPDMVAPLYKRKYWDKVSGDQLPKGLTTRCSMLPSTAGRAVLLSGCKRLLEYLPMVPLAPRLWLLCLTLHPESWSPTTTTNGFSSLCPCRLGPPLGRAGATGFPMFSPLPVCLRNSTMASLKSP